MQVHPNLALGGNSAIEGVACLINNIQHVMQTTCRGSKPSGTALSMAFASYQNEHCQRMKELMNLSNMVAKIHTYATPFHKLLGNLVLPVWSDRTFADHVGAYIAAAPKLDFIKSTSFTSGRLAWKDKGADKTSKENFDEDKMLTQVAEIAIAA